MSFFSSFVAQLTSERPRWILWAPVLIGCGIHFYDGFPGTTGLLVASGALMSGAWMEAGTWQRFFFGHKKNTPKSHDNHHPKGSLGDNFFPWMLFLLCLGFFRIYGQSVFCPTPMLQSPLEPSIIYGTIGSIEHRLKNHLGYSLVLHTLSIKKTSLRLKKIRISLHKAPQPLWVGQRIWVFAPLKPIPPPVSPHGYNQRRQNFFQGIGAMGHAFKAGVIKEPRGRLMEILVNMRHHLTRMCLEYMPPPTGALGAALITGDKGSIPLHVRQVFSQAGLSHILAISGLHLSIVAGLFFVIFKKGAVLIPAIALRVSTQKIAACFSLAATALYLVLSGSNPPAQRSFLMTACVLIALLIDRKGLTLRLVAFAATIVLLWAPYEIFGPSFQLSFAAVVALVAFYENKELLSPWWGEHGPPSFYNKTKLYLMGSLCSTLVATAATLPYTLYTFQSMTLQGVVANMVAIPFTTFFIMPCAVLTCLLAFFQENPFSLQALSWGLDHMVSFATVVSTWPGAAISIPKPPAWCVGVITLGGLWFFLWTTPWRWYGAGGVIVGAFFLWPHKNPGLQIWISADGALSGCLVQNTSTLWVSSLQKGRFVRHFWMKEGNASTSKKLFHASTPRPFRCNTTSCTLVCEGIRVLIAQDASSHPWRHKAHVVISHQPFVLPPSIPLPTDKNLNITPKDQKKRLLVDPVTCQKNGPHYLRIHKGILSCHTGLQIQGRKPWTPQ